MTTVTTSNSDLIQVATYGSRSMYLIQEELARAQIRQRLDDAERARIVRAARARRVRQRRLALPAVRRARLLVAFGRG